MKFFSLILILWTTIICSGQTKERFLNAVRKNVVDSLFTKYYLNLNAHKLTLDSVSTMLIRNELSKYTSSEKIDELLNKSALDTLNLTWDCKLLDLADCIKTVDGILINDLVLYTNQKWSKRKRKKEIKRQTFEQRNKQNKRLNQEKVFYSLSRPIFDDKNEYVLIEVSAICGRSCGQHCILIFKCTDSIWKIVKKVNCKIS